MDKEFIGKLLGIICIHYPSSEKNYKNPDGTVKENVINEWYRCIGWMNAPDAIKRLDEYLMQDEGNKFAPTIKWFMWDAKKNQSRREVYFADRKDRQWFVDQFGRLYDEEGREYADPPEFKPFYIDAAGHVCRENTIVFQHGERFDYFKRFGIAKIILKHAKGREHI